MSKDNRYYLEKMQENVEFILEHMDSVSKSDLENDPVLLDSRQVHDHDPKASDYNALQDNVDVPSL